MSLSSLRSLINVNHKIVSTDIDDLIMILTTQLNQIINNYEYRSEKFIPYEPLVPRTESEILPNFTDMDFALQEIDKFKQFLTDMELDHTTNYETVANYFKRIFAPRDLFIPPILAFLQSNELLIIGGIDNIVIL